MAQRIHRSVHLRSLSPLGSVVSSAAARLRRGLQGPTVQNHRRGTGLAPGKLAQQTAQILDHDFKAAGIEPAPHLLIDHRPGRQIVRHEAPLVAGLHDIPQAVEHRSQRIVPLCCILPAQRQIRSHKRPLLICHVAWIPRLVRISHRSIVGHRDCDAHNNDSKGIKLITGSRKVDAPGCDPLLPWRGSQQDNE